MRRCPHCGRRMIRMSLPLARGSDVVLSTRDHIRPREFGGRNDRGENIRRVCRDCNVLRAACGHCVGAMACVVAVAEGTQRRPGMVAAEPWMARARRLARRRFARAWAGKRWFE